MKTSKFCGAAAPLMLAFALLSACSDNATPAGPVGPGVGADGGGAVADGGAGNCSEFATEHERLLNAPTDSKAIKKTVTLPAP